MASVINKRPNQLGIYQYKNNVDITDYPSSSWEHNPDISNVVNINRRYWKHDNSNTIVEMSQSEKDRVDSNIANGRKEIGTGTIAFEKGGKVRNKWLGFGSNKASNKSPFVIPTFMNVTAITFINEQDRADTDIEIYKNGTKIYTWALRNKRWAWKTSNINTLMFSPGDLLSVYLKDQGNDPRHVIFTLHYASWAHEESEEGSETL